MPRLSDLEELWQETFWDYVENLLTVQQRLNEQEAERLKPSIMERMMREARRMLTLDEINIRVRDIDMVKNDPEYAHMLEDDLYTDVMKTFASYPDSAIREMARAALKTRALEFPRWYA